MSTGKVPIENRPDGFASGRVVSGVLYVATRDFLLGTRYLAQGDVALLDPQNNRVKLALQAEALIPYDEVNECPRSRK